MGKKRPNCPDCSTVMDYHGKDVIDAQLNQWWKCPACGQTCLRKIDPNIFIQILKRVMEHNPAHFTEVWIFKNKIKACSRCLGTYIAMMLFMPIFGYIYFFNNMDTFTFDYHSTYFSAYFVIFISFSLATLTIIDFVTVDVFHMREGNNKIRITTGFLLGFAATFYFWFLPTHWFIRVGTLICYNLIAMVLAGIAMYLWRLRSGKTQISDR